MYKILIHIDTQSGDKWFYYQENGKDYVTNSLQEIKDTVLTLIDVYGEDYIKIVKQMSGQDMNNADEYLYNSTDSYEDLDNRPFINGVEIVGQLSLEDLGIQPAGDYLDQTDLEEIENKINSIDVSAYATNERVDQVEDKIDNIDLGRFYTKEETDAKDNERLRGYFWDYKGNCITTGSSLERISQSRYGTTFQELSALWDQIAVGGMHPIEVKDKNNYRAWLMPNGTAGGSTYIIYKYRGQVILNTPSSAADASLYRSYYLEFRVNRDDNKLWEADFLCKEGYEQPSMARVENYVQEQTVNLTGDLTTLATEDKSNLVNAINEVITNMGEVEVDIDIPVYSLTSSANFQNSSFNFNDILTELSNIVTNNLEKPIMVIVRSNNSTSLNYKKFCVLLLCYASPTSVLSNVTDTIRGFTVDNSTGDISIVTFSTRRNNTVGAIAFTSFSSGSTYANYLHSQNALSKYNTTAFTPTEDYNPATKKYVDDSVAAIPVYEEPEIKTYYFDWSNLVEFSDSAVNSTRYTLPEADVERLTQIINEEHSNGYPRKSIFVFALKFGRIAIGDTYRASGVGSGHYCIQTLSISGVDANRNYASLSYDFYIYTILDKTTNTVTLTGEMNATPQYNCSIPNRYYVDNHFLSKTNIYSYTPTANYHPATKKYVDDTVANIDIPTSSDSIKTFEIEFDIDITSTNVNTYNSIDANVRNVLNELVTYCKNTSSEVKLIVHNTNTKSNVTPSLELYMRDKLNQAGGQISLFSSYYYAQKYYETSFGINYNKDTGLLLEDGDKIILQIHTYQSAYLKESTYNVYPTGTYYFNKNLPQSSIVPSADVHLTNKKYVDDAVASVSGGSGGGADLTNYYTKAEVDALLQELRNEFVSANNNINDKLETIIYGGE